MVPEALVKLESIYNKRSTWVCLLRWHTRHAVTESRADSWAAKTIEICKFLRDIIELRVLQE